MRIGFAVVALAAALAATPSLAIQRTFVASYGNDANACTPGSPCRSFTAALLKTSGFGEIIVLDSAGYGPVTIAKSVSIIAPQGIYAGVTVPTGDGITVNALPAIVTLRGLTINGQGTGGIGVNIMNATRVNIEGCVISNMSSNGILHSAPGSQLSVLDTIVRSNGGTGIGIAADASVVIDHVRSEQNAFDGFYIIPGTTTAQAAITDSLFAWNGTNGVSIDSVPGRHTHVAVERSVMPANSGSGLSAYGTGFGFVTVGRNVFSNNADAAISVSHNNRVMVSENNFNAGNATGVRADGGSVEVRASANAFSTNGGFQFQQLNGAYFATYGNNTGQVNPSGTITVIGGQ